MNADGSVVVVGGTTGLGREVARHYAAAGADVVISGRREADAQRVAAELGGNARGIAVDLGEPKGIAGQLAGIGQVKHLVLTPILRDHNRIAEFDIDGATHLLVMKLIGYAETVHQLLDRLGDDSSIVLFGGLAKERPYPGSTTVTTVNGGIVGLVRTMTHELAPIRVNAIHPGMVVDSPYWSDKNLDHVLARTPSKRLTRMDDITHAVVFLLENRAVNGTNLFVDGGWSTT
jgi:NAD(P)-dependent dehydrogenase (short-subunit alcohol dehydrogenase family)